MLLWKNSNKIGGLWMAYRPSIGHRPSVVVVVVVVVVVIVVVAGCKVKSYPSI